MLFRREAAMTGLTAATAASQAQRMLAEGEPLLSVWRYCIIQLLDDYASEARRLGAERASQRFDGEPAPTGASEVDAGLAALAEYLARRDGRRATRDLDAAFAPTSEVRP